MTPYQAVKKHCVYCMNGKIYEVAKCTATTCWWYDWRKKKPENSGSTLKAIKKYCLEECVGLEDPGARERVKNCDIIECPLHPFRLGKNPYKKPISPERLEKMRERMRHAQKSVFKGKTLEGEGLSSHR